MSGRARARKQWPTERVLFAQSYYKGAAALNTESLPTTRHTETYQPREGYIQAVGIVERSDGTRLEFHDVRLYFPHVPKETTEDAPPG